MTAGVTLGEYIRNTAINGNITARLTPEDVKLIRSLSGMANNLNQLAKMQILSDMFQYLNPCQNWLMK